MIERLSQKRQNEQGFTLVELLVVIVILGILAAIVVFAVGGITDKGTSSANSTDISVLQTAEEAAFAQSTATPPLYLSESALLSGKYIRALSSKNDICLSNAVAGPPAVAAAVDYKTIPQTTPATACPAGYTLAP
jgi:prepilin-type N-terminal cleavage/methylation domain-containing protein